MLLMSELDNWSDFVTSAANVGVTIVAGDIGGSATPHVLLIHWQIL